MLNKVSYLSKSASIVFVMFFVGMNIETQSSKSATPGPHVDAIRLS